ncbi:ParB N-terminal domain-containing protein [Candidatus Contubernalis alkaliaceticus]|uniref:ParB N-terminal domain-containing protein n=1 Tax=Candidatus Contubernalis alkaliaceticus TaxID=338645 RepID=UPI001F4C0554|nr:ParB N-terminal domain-containing protein [Candidatus Contubernalis alkalaceticus]UNC91679.1 ParB N-terminal domain-containing protein [Candidatus Contubernalis alkalaceticus]
MLIDIGKITVKDRIRKDYGDIDELAQDIKENGLINPPVVTPEYELIAGERRLRAINKLGYSQVEVRVMSVKDYEHQLNLEISENESRKEFTRKERLEYAQKLIELKRLQGLNLDLDEDQVTQEASKESGIGSRAQFYKEKFISENADEETLEKWDKGDISTHAAYQKILKERDELKAKLEKAQNTVDQVVEERNKLKEETSSLQSNVNTTNQVLKDTQGTVKMLQDELKKERERGKTEVERLVGLLDEAKKTGSSDEKIKQLENELAAAKGQVEELTKKINEPVEKVPEEVEKELNDLREKTRQLENKAGQPEQILKFRVQFDTVVTIILRRYWIYWMRLKRWLRKSARAIRVL